MQRPSAILFAIFVSSSIVVPCQAGTLDTTHSAGNMPRSKRSIEPKRENVLDRFLQIKKHDEKEDSVKDTRPLETAIITEVADAGASPAYTTAMHPQDVNTAAVSGVAPQITGEPGFDGLSALERDNVIHKIDNGFYRGRQPSQELMQKLKECGVRSLIDLRIPGHRVSADRKLAESLGLNFIHIPVNPVTGIKDYQVKAFLAAVNDTQNRPVYMYCFTGLDRTIAMMGIYHIHKNGWTADQAYRDMRTQGFRAPFGALSEAVFDYGEKLGRGGKKPFFARFNIF